MSSPVSPAAPEPDTPVAVPAPSKAELRAQRRAEMKTDLKWATVLLFVLIMGVSSIPRSFPLWNRPLTGEEDLAAVTDEIFAQDGLVVPFEILSVLLLAALVAGVVIAFRDPEGEA